jgi:alcohol dehydrogenase class IV
MRSSFQARTRVFSSLGAADDAVDHLRQLGGGDVILVADEGVVRAGILNGMRERIEDANDVSVVDVILGEANPSVQMADIVAEQSRRTGANLVLAVGGGSTMSIAKCVAIRLRNDASIRTFQRSPIPVPPAPIVAIPTTAGSGSEVSNALVLYDEASPTHFGMRAEGLEPDIAVLDGLLLTGLPRTPMIDAAVDALSHAFEALWARGSSAFTDALALAAIRQIRTVLPRALASRQPADLQVLLEASTMANFACGNAGLGLVHALDMSTAIQASHGRQNGILLPHVAAFNRDAVSAEAQIEIDALEELYAAIGFDPVWMDGEVPDDADELMVGAALGNPFHGNNRRPATSEDLHRLLSATHR